MATTAIFAEILIVGLQALVWLVLASVAILGVPSVDVSSLEGWEGLITLAILAVAYALGIVVDRVADSVFDPFDRLLREKHIPSSPLSVPEMRLRIMSESEGMASFLDYVRSRVRIARSTAFNCALIVGAAILLDLRREATVGGLVRHEWLVLTMVVGAALSALALFAWVRITKTYNWRLDQAYRIVCEKRATGDD